MTSIKVLLVDDDETVRTLLQNMLEACEFEVVVACTVNEALKLITTQTFDVLLTDLHMPNAGDGLTVASVMRHMNPNAVTILLSANPDMNKAVEAIREQTDEILRKPVKMATMVEVIRKRLSQSVPREAQVNQEQEAS